MNPLPRTRIHFQLPGHDGFDPTAYEFPSACELPNVGDHVHLPDAIAPASQNRVFKVTRRVFLMTPSSFASEVVLVLE